MTQSRACAYHAGRREEDTIESREQFLKRFARVGGAAFVALMLVGAVGCGGEEEEEEEDD